MKGIYLTEEGKQEIEAKIAEISKYTYKRNGKNDGKIEELKTILSSAIVLPVEESWIDIGEKHGTFYEDDAKILSDYFSQGVIIQPK